jgi:DNA repair protein RadD
MSSVRLRAYQQESIDAVLKYWEDGGGNPLIELATGLGKSVVIAEMLRHLCASYPDMRLLLLVHVRELVKQDFEQLRRLWPAAPVGVYSAGLGMRQGHTRIVCASIQSVFRKARQLGPRDIVLIDESHLVPHAGEGMYQRLLTDLRELTPDMRCVGLTATPYRLDSGRLDHGDDRLFDRIVYTYNVGDGIADGWLAPLTARAASVEIDVAEVARRGGEFIPGALEQAANRDELVEAAADEISRLGRDSDRKSWLIFCSGVRHAAHVRDALRARGVRTETVTGDTPSGERDRIVADFKAGRITALTNAQVLTTGFDAPGVDLIAFLRPTLSTGLYVQMIGRGTRPVWPAGAQPDAMTAEERVAMIAGSAKANCLILDFAGNVRRHGPVDAVTPKGEKRAASNAAEQEVKVGVNEVRARECPNCQTLLNLRAAECTTCGHVFPAEPKHEAKPDMDVALLAKEVKPAEAPVYSWSAKRHEKLVSPGADEPPATVRVSYNAGLMKYEEWICPEHGGYAGDKFVAWWRRHGGAEPPPDNVAETLDRWRELTRPEVIFVKPDGQWWRIAGRRMPERREGAAA